MSIFSSSVFSRSGALRNALIGSSVFALAATTACLDSNMDGGGAGGGDEAGGAAGVTSVFTDPDRDGPTPMAAGTPTAAVTCAVDSLAGIAPTGRIGLPFEGGDIIALCDGWMLIADKTNERVELRNVVTGEIDTQWNLPGAPDDLELDVAEETIYATLPDENLVAAVDMNSGNVEVAAVNSTPTTITQSTNHLLVAADAGAELRAYEKPGLTLVALHATLEGETIIFNAAANQLISVSEADVSLFNYNDAPATTSTLARVRTDPAVPAAAIDIDITSDGVSVAFVNAAGNASAIGPNVVNDLSAADVDQVFGGWKVEAGPTSVAFSDVPVSTYAMASSDEDMIVFDFARHAELSRNTPTSACGGSFDETEFSAGGAIAFGKMNCSGTGTEIHWIAPAAGFGNSASAIGAPFATLSLHLPISNGSPLCSTDIATPAVDGQITIPLAEDFEPWCDGLVFLTERATNRIVLKDVFANTTLAEWDLRDMPSELLLDDNNQFLYAIMPGGGGLAQIDLAGPAPELGALVQQEAAGFPESITLGAGFDVWTTSPRESGVTWLLRTEGDAMVDGGPTIEAGGYGLYIPEVDFTSQTTQVAYDRTTDTLFLSDTNGFARFGVNPDAGGGTLDQVVPGEEVFDTLNSEIVVASPDDFSIAFVDQTADLIYDFETGSIADFTDTFWQVDSLLDMTGIAFNSTGERLGVATTDELIIFDAEFPGPGTHDELGTFEPLNCEPDPSSRPGVSRGNGIGFYLSNCGNNAVLTETLYWYRL